LTMAGVPSNESVSLATFSDGITDLGYLSKADKALLASACWDGSFRLHDTASRSPVLAHAMESGPLLSLAIPPTADYIATGGLDGSIRLLDLESSVSTLVGQHRAAGSTETKQACSCLVSLDEEESNILASAGWSRKLHIWDVREQNCVSQLELPGKAFAMDVDKDRGRIVVATSGRRMCFIDVRKGKAELVLDRESSLKYQTRVVKYGFGGHGLALGSVEGRVGIEFLEELGLKPPMKKYAFKCHRVNDTVYPVNCICFHPRFPNTFATGGCDGTVVLWDGMNKKKLTTLSPFPTSVSAIAFSQDGNEIAVASSYTHEEGDREHPQDEIFVRRMQEVECMPKEK